MIHPHRAEILANRLQRAAEHFGNAAEIRRPRTGGVGHKFSQAAGRLEPPRRAMLHRGRNG